MCLNVRVSFLVRFKVCEFCSGQISSDDLVNGIVARMLQYQDSLASDEIAAENAT